MQNFIKTQNRRSASRGLRSFDSVTAAAYASSSRICLLYLYFAVLRLSCFCSTSVRRVSLGEFSSILRSLAVSKPGRHFLLASGSARMELFVPLCVSDALLRAFRASQVRDLRLQLDARCLSHYCRGSGSALQGCTWLYGATALHFPSPRI